MAKFEDELVLKDSASEKLDKISGKMSDLSNKGEKLKSVFGKMTGGLKTVGKTALSITGSLTKVGLSAIGISATSVGALAMSCSQAARDAEELNAVMDLLTGSSEKSKKVFEDLDKEVGLFSRDTLRGLSIQMLDNGISTEKLIPTLKMLEGFSMGSADNLKKLTDSLTQVSATGRVTAQSLKALSAVGIDGQKEMQKQLGVTPKLFNKLLSAGRITFNDYERLLTRVYNSTEKYNQSMDKLSGTINGKFDILHNKLSIVGDRLRESLGRIALPYLEKIADKMTQWVDKLNNLPIEKVENLNEVLKATGKLFEGIMWVIQKVIDLFSGLYNMAKSFVGTLTGLVTDTKNFAEAFNSMSWSDIGSGLWNGDLLDKVSEIQRQNSKEKAKNITQNITNETSSVTNYISQAVASPVKSEGNTTNMTNTFNISGTVREEADISRIGRAIADSIELKFNNMGAY